MTTQLRELCRARSVIREQDLPVLEALEAQLQLIADVAQADVFLDCPTLDKETAVVVAQAAPSTAKSLYRNSVVGQAAHANREPAVLFSLMSGLPVVGHRGITQEGKVMLQNVIPVTGDDGKTIGVLIKEQDLSTQLEHEKNVEMLMEATEHLSESLLQTAMSESQLPSLVQEGIFLGDEQHVVQYANKRANELLLQIGYTRSAKGIPVAELLERLDYRGHFCHRGGVIYEEKKMKDKIYLLKAVPMYRGEYRLGSVILLSDITETKMREKQLMVKSAVLQEIHHRVKNNLQTIVSLLRLQLRRTKSAEVHDIFRESVRRINSIAVVHEYLAQTAFESVDFVEVLRRIILGATGSDHQPEPGPEITFTETPLLLMPEQATTLSLVVSELLHNCLKHAFVDRTGGKVDIRLAREGDNISVAVKDDGIGMQEAPSGNDNHHLGLTIVKTLVEEDLEGDLCVERLERGTRVTVTFVALHSEG